MIDDANALAWIAEPELEVVVFELAVAGPAVQPAWKARVIGVDEVDLLQRFEPEGIETVVNPTERKRIRVLRPCETIFTNRDIRDLAAAARHSNERRARFVVGKVGNAQDIGKLARDRHQSVQSSKSARWLA